MSHCTALRALKQSFQRVLPAEDGRTKLTPLDFVTGVVFCFLSDTKSFGLEAMRRFLMAQFEVAISKGAFWERLSSPRLKRQLYDVIGELMRRLRAMSLVEEAMLEKLGVKAIYLVDASVISLWDGARQRFPGTWTTAAIKWHACFDLLSGRCPWFDLSPGSTHDRQCFPPLHTLAGKLMIFDLGYWDYGLLLAIEAARGFFLSRVKRNAGLVITEVVHGLSSKYCGHKLSALSFQRRRQPVVEVLARVVSARQAAVFRVIGFWNPSEKKYHWYITNLAVSAYLLYPLYRLRWQLELVFKASKRSFNLDRRLTSNDTNMIEALVLSSLIAGFAAQTVLQLGAQRLSAAQRLAISFQRAAYVVVQLASDFIRYLTRPEQRFAETLANKITLFARELFEKNHQHRPTSLGRLQAQLGV